MSSGKNDDYLSPQKAAELLDISIRTFWYWVTNGDIPADCLVRFGATVRVNKAKIIALGIKNAQKHIEKLQAARQEE